jgi:hypothetical protein
MRLTEMSRPVRTPTAPNPGGLFLAAGRIAKERQKGIELSRAHTNTPPIGHAGIGVQGRGVA